MKFPRRTLLRAAGVSLALPWLEALRPARAAEPTQPPRRLLAICTNLGILDRHFLPEKSGPDFELTPYLEILKDFRQQFTVISGTSHPDVSNGHASEASFLSAAPQPGTPSFRNTISLDQYAAERIGRLTRFPSLTLAVSQQGNPSLSCTSSGVMLPAERSPGAVFRALFVDGDQAAVEKQIEQLRIGRSILDVVGARAKSLEKRLTSADRGRLDQFFTSVRDVEQRLQTAQEWERKPKPKVDQPEPKEGEFLLHKLDAMYDVVRLAFATDSTRLITIMLKLDGFGAQVPGVSDESHNLSHHVGREDKLTQLQNLELAQFRQLATLLTRLRDTREGDDSLLDRTMLVYGSNLGNANSHDTRNLPILLAGGGFRHGQHLAFDKTHNEPLANLFVSLLQRQGIETDRFASSTGTLRGLEPVGL